jgi:hypothetical protein
MAAIFSKPKIPPSAFPPPPPPPPPDPVIKPAATPAAVQEQTRTIEAAKAKKGYRSTIMTRTPAIGGSSGGGIRTGGLGLLESAPVAKKRLLGQ